jgi:hypothetical protein
MYKLKEQEMFKHKSTKRSELGKHESTTRPENGQTLSCIPCIPLLDKDQNLITLFAHFLTESSKVKK